MENNNQLQHKKVTQEMRDALRKPLPEEAVTKHPTKTYLSSIKAIYVVERLNDVFGLGSYIITSEEISAEDGAPVVKVRLQIPEYGIDLSSYGGNDNGGKNSKNYDLGDAYKGAATDALTKICSWLEIGLSVFKGMGNKPMEITVEDAIAEYLKAESREEAGKVWGKYKQFQNNPHFIKAAKALGALYPKKEVTESTHDTESGAADKVTTEESKQPVERTYRADGKATVNGKTYEEATPEEREKAKDAPDMLSKNQKTHILELFKNPAQTEGTVKKVTEQLSKGLSATDAEKVIEVLEKRIKAVEAQQAAEAKTNG